MDVQKSLLDVNWPKVTRLLFPKFFPKKGDFKPWKQELLKFEAAAEEVGGVEDKVLYRGPRVRMGIHFGKPKSHKDPILCKLEFTGKKNI